MPLNPAAIRKTQQLILVQIPLQTEIDLLEADVVAEIGRFDQPFEFAIVPVIPLYVHQMRDQLIGGEGLLDGCLHGSSEGSGHPLKSHGGELRWRQQVLEGLKSSKGRKKDARDTRIKELEKELRRKEKALAEAAALLVLKKKPGRSGGTARTKDRR